MPELPHGWRMRNSEGEKAGPPIEEDGAFSGDDSDNEFDLAEPLDIRPDSEGWEDAEEDVESIAIKCFMCEENFPDAKKMVEHCKESHAFDFLGVHQAHKLDFFSAIRLVNYIRSEVKVGQTKPDVSDAKLWADDKYMQPSLQDDALLFSLDDILDTVDGDEEDTKAE